MGLSLRPLSRSFGAETFDIDLSEPMGQAAFDDLSRAFFASQVLVLRAQKLSPGQFLNFARRWGPPEPHVIDQFHHPHDPNILILSNVMR